MYKCLPFWDPIQIQALGRRCVPRPQALLPLPRPHALLPFLWSHLLQLLYAGTSYSSCPIAAESRATTEEGTDGAGVQRGGQREEETGGRRERERRKLVAATVIGSCSTMRVGLAQGHHCHLQNFLYPNPGKFSLRCATTK